MSHRIKCTFRWTSFHPYIYCNYHEICVLRFFVSYDFRCLSMWHLDPIWYKHIPRKSFHWGRVNTSSSNQVRRTRAEHRSRRTAEQDPDASSPTEMLLNRKTEPVMAVGRCHHRHIPFRSSCSSAVSGIHIFSPSGQCPLPWALHYSQVHIHQVN